ncbi:hypothetical protein PUN28_018623 [Cardiocondyla obscurior]|uniref:Uncharacterized protein n=1 Tax=Cardiocondyla obscurior TaxID=286306 RepID=A0AAW2EK60_9HYME
MSISSVNDLQSPPAVGLLAPKVYAEEGPVVEVGAEDVARSLEQQQSQISSREKPQRNLRLKIQLIIFNR